MLIKFARKMDPNPEPASTPNTDPAPDPTPAPTVGGQAPAPNPAPTPAPTPEPAVPESYTFAQVDGQDVDPSLAEEVSAFAKEHRLTQEQAQVLMNYELHVIKTASEQSKQAVQQVQKQWREQVAADPEIGGANLEANLATAKAALQRFFPEIAKDAEKHPFLDHPGVIKGLLAIGKQISPDGNLVTGRGNDTPVDPAKRLFPNMA